MRVDGQKKGLDGGISHFVLTVNDAKFTPRGLSKKPLISEEFAIQWSGMTRNSFEFLGFPTIPPEMFRIRYSMVWSSYDFLLLFLAFSMIFLEFLQMFFLRN